MTTSRGDVPNADFISKIESNDLDSILHFLADFWRQYRQASETAPVVPSRISDILLSVINEDLPRVPQSIDSLLSETADLLNRGTVKTGSPRFLGYVTPPSSNIGALGDALAAITNQNVSFAALSPIGTALEMSVVNWLGQILGMDGNFSGLLTDGGSSANAAAIAVARRQILGEAFQRNGYASHSRALRIYCSEETHHSIDKAAVNLGIGSNNVVRIPVDGAHQIDLKALASSIESDSQDPTLQPFLLVANAGTRMCCAFDPIEKMEAIARRWKLWLHVDAAYGGFLRLAKRHNHNLDQLHLADSAIIDPHKLLFAPFACGALIVRDPKALAACFGSAEGEYIEPALTGEMVNYSNLGNELGRPMRALKVWLIMRRYGSEALGREYQRLIDLAHTFAREVSCIMGCELLGPVDGTAVCFRWSPQRERIDRANALNSRLRKSLLQGGIASVDEVSISGKVGLRVCMTNFRTTEQDLDLLTLSIKRELGV